MNTVVNQLLEVDRKARQLIDEAQQYYDKTIEEIGVEKEKLRSRYQEGAELRIQQVEQVESQQVDEEISIINAECDRLTKIMESLYDSCHEDWEQELFQRCVGG